MRVKDKLRLLVLSHVFPFPLSAGQNQRVFYTLQTARDYFHVTFAAHGVWDEEDARRRLAAVCDDVIFIPSSYYTKGKALKAWHKAHGTINSLRTGLKTSNYLIGQVEFSPDRLAPLAQSNHFDCVLFEYWHAANSAAVFKERGIPCVLDMHNILWQSYIRQMNDKQNIPQWWKQWAVGRYRVSEEAAWEKFDGVVAINRGEFSYVRERIPETTKLFYAPMGTDLTLWPYSWAPVRPPRVGYYGALGGVENQQEAMRCYKQIMPHIWKQRPDAELWLVGSNPPEHIRELAEDARVKVTGFVEDVQQILKTMSAVLCPWSGTYGFRSRVVEVMALGVPVVASPDAVYGMEYEDGKGILLGKDNAELAKHTLRLIVEAEFASRQSRLARQQTERLFSLESTYGNLNRELNGWLNARIEQRNQEIV